MTIYQMKSTHRCVDVNGNIGSFVGYWSGVNSVSLGTDILAANGFSSALDAVMDARIYETEVHLILPLATVKPSPVAGSLLTRRGALHFEPTSSPHPYTLSVPAVKSSLISGNQIDWPTTLLTALEPSMTAGGSPPWISDRYFNTMLTLNLLGNLTFNKLRRILAKNR